MARRQAGSKAISRRQFLRNLPLTAPLLLPSPLRGAWHTAFDPPQPVPVPFPDSTGGTVLRLSPDYPATSPLEAILKLVVPGSDAYTSEKQAADLKMIFERFRSRLTAGEQAGALRDFLHPDAGGSARMAVEREVRNAFGIRVTKRTYAHDSAGRMDSLAAQLAEYFSSLGKLLHAEFEITSVEEPPSRPGELETAARYSLAGTRAGDFREERVGQCRLRWRKDNSGNWRIANSAFENETVATARKPPFADFTEQALGHTQSYRKQLAHGIDYWRTVLDVACGIDI